MTPLFSVTMKSNEQTSVLLRKSAHVLCIKWTKIIEVTNCYFAHIASISYLSPGLRRRLEKFLKSYIVLRKLGGGTSKL